MTSTEIAKLTAKKKSKTIGGKGTMMTPKMQIKKPTTARLFAFTIGAIKGAR